MKRILLYSSGSILLEDSFTDDDNVLLPAHIIAPINVHDAAWVKESTEDLKIVSNKADAVDVTVAETSYHSVNVQLPDLTVECDINISNASPSAGMIIARFIDEDNWIGLLWNQFTGFARSGAITQTKAGVLTTLAVFPELPASLDGTAVNVKLVSTPTKLIATINGAYETSFNSTTFANATKAGIYVTVPQITFENFKVSVSQWRRLQPQTCRMSEQHIPKLRKRNK